jgi:hypothetical protein
MAEVLELIGFQARAVRGQQARDACPLHGSEPDSRVLSANLARNRNGDILYSK